MDVATAKGLLEQLAARLAWCRLVYEPLTPREGVEHPGRTAAVVARQRRRRSARRWAASVSCIRACWSSTSVRAEHVVFAEIDLDAFERLVPERLRVGELEHLPGVERDIAVVVAADRAGR